MIGVNPNLTYEGILERMYREYTSVVRITDFKGRFISEFAVSVNEPPPIDLEHLTNLGYEVVDLEADPRTRDTITAIYGPFWTCDCEHKFVKHHADFKCKKCGAKFPNEKPLRLPEVSIDLPVNKDMWAFIN